jgi:PLP dependent protein
MCGINRYFIILQKYLIRLYDSPILYLVLFSIAFFSKVYYIIGILLICPNYMINDNLNILQKRIEKSCRKSGRNFSEITLVGVTKTLPSDIIKEAVSCGIYDLGENKVQELLSKKDDLPIDIRWHLIGHLQRNKAKLIVDFVHLIHSIDTIDLAVEIDRLAKKVKRQIPVLVQVNTSFEDSKFGTEPENTLSLVKEISALENIKVTGLMTIGAFFSDPEMVRPCFKNLKSIFDKIKALNLNNVEMEHLSMGMTNDFEVAIEEGATIIRIGTALFGERNYSRA